MGTGLRHTTITPMILHHPMRGLTPDMVNWWFAWHGLEDLRYMLWSPKDHFAVSMTDDDRAKVLNPAARRRRRRDAHPLLDARDLRRDGGRRSLTCRPEVYRATDSQQSPPGAPGTRSAPVGTRLCGFVL